jgi:hypothetical protein
LAVCSGWPHCGQKLTGIARFPEWERASRDRVREIPAGTDPWKKIAYTRFLRGSSIRCCRFDFSERLADEY